MAADWSKTAPIALPALLWTLTSCAQQAQKTTTPSAAAQTEQPSSPQPAEREQRPTTPSPSSSVAQSVSPQNLDGFADEPALKDVFFAPDRADIVGEPALIMRANARWLLTRWLIQNLHDLVLIEGHTDDTGTREDQLAVAELRAQAVASFLRAMNVPAERLWTVGYGSDRPLCKGKSDACVAKNRRVHFRVKRQ
jgi:outer membrane protein OmpA-like peptidoglycan-associated protein